MHNYIRSWVKENNIKVTDSELEKIVSDNDSLPSAALKIIKYTDKRVKELYGKIFSWLLSSGYNPNSIIDATKRIAYKEPTLVYNFLDEVYSHKSPYGAISYALAVIYRSKEHSKEGDLSLKTAINSLGPQDIEKKVYRKV